MASSLTFAVPVEWNSTTAYEINMIVFVGKKAYTALQNVPAGTEITNTDYWSETGVPFVDIAAIRTKLNEIEGEVDDNTADIETAQADILTNANNITQVSTRLNAAVSSIEADAARLNNIMITLYSPQTTTNGGN